MGVENFVSNYYMQIFENQSRIALTGLNCNFRYQPFQKYIENRMVLHLYKIIKFKYPTLFGNTLRFWLRNGNNCWINSHIICNRSLVNLQIFNVSASKHNIVKYLTWIWNFCVRSSTFCPEKLDWNDKIQFCFK